MALLYIAGSLFNVAERYRQLKIERCLRDLGDDTINPIREAQRYMKKNGMLDLGRVAEDCMEKAGNREIIVVANSDGTDTDGGTGVECGIAIGRGNEVVVWRTDFRTSRKHEVGINAMLHLKAVHIIYHPCFVTNLTEFDSFYWQVALKIHQKVLQIERARK